MKILYVAMKYDYGDQKKGYDSLQRSSYNTLIKMNGGSIDIVCFPYDGVLINEGRDEMNKKLLETVFNEKPNGIFFGVGDDFIKKETIKEITKKSGAVTFNWHTDDTWKFYNYSKYWAPLYHYVITTDPDSLEKYHKIGYKNAILSQWGYDHLTYKPLNLPKIYDVTFVGLPHGNRKKIIRKLKKLGVRVKCWGRGWPAGKVSQEDMLKIFSQSKINLNFTKSAGVFWKELASIFLCRDYERKIKLVNPTHWIDNLKTMQAALFAKQFKARIFEIPGCKTFLLTEYVNHLEDYYEIGKEIECFCTVKELSKKIDYYLKNEEEREKIAEAGYKRTIQDHTWEKRFNEIFKIVGLIK